MCPVSLWWGGERRDVEEVRTGEWRKRSGKEEHDASNADMLLKGKRITECSGDKSCVCVLCYVTVVPRCFCMSDSGVSAEMRCYRNVTNQKDCNMQNSRSPYQFPTKKWPESKGCAGTNGKWSDPHEASTLWQLWSEISGTHVAVFMMGQASASPLFATGRSLGQFCGCGKLLFVRWIRWKWFKGQGPKIPNVEMTATQLEWPPQKLPGGCLPAAAAAKSCCRPGTPTAAFCHWWILLSSLCCHFILFFSLFVTALVPGSIPLELREQLHWLL